MCTFDTDYDAKAAKDEPTKQVYVVGLQGLLDKGYTGRELEQAFANMCMAQFWVSLALQQGFSDDEIQGVVQTLPLLGDVDEIAQLFLRHSKP